jgi:hypothetical protein
MDLLDWWKTKEKLRMSILCSNITLDATTKKYGFIYQGST